MNGKGIIGNIPANDLALMMGLTSLCVHGCASARSPLFPPSPRAHLAPPRNHCSPSYELSVDRPYAALRRSLGTNQLNGDTNRLNGPIPTELGLLTGLTTLDLHNNKLEGPIPPEVGQLTALTYLDVYNSQLNGTIPTELRLLTALTTLCVHGCASARSPLPPPSARAHLAPLRLHALHFTLSVDALAPPRCAGP